MTYTVILLAISFVFTGCSKYFDEGGWVYLGEEHLTEGLLGIISTIIVGGFLIFFIYVYLWGVSGISKEKDEVYIDGEKHTIERIVNVEKLSRSEAWHQTSIAFSWVFFIALWLFIYGNIIFLIGTELNWMIDVAIALVGLWLSYLFYKSSFYSNNRTLVHIISFVACVIIIVSKFKS